jgi:hypothetical protein
MASKELLEKMKQHYNEARELAKESLDYWYDQFAEYRKIHKNEI